MPVDCQFEVGNVCDHPECEEFADDARWAHAPGVDEAHVVLGDQLYTEQTPLCDNEEASPSAARAGGWWQPGDGGLRRCRSCAARLTRAHIARGAR